MGSLRTKELSKIGYTNDRARSLVINTISKHFKYHTKEQLIELFSAIKASPELYVTDAVVGKIAETFIEKEAPCHHQSFSLLQEKGQLKIYGGKEIEHSAKQQMEIAMSLPVILQGALMPDAHTGYGLPIGGVLATDNAVVPYAVGVDIGCRMALSVIDEGERFIKRYAYQMKMALKECTHFGMEGGLEIAQEHAVLEDPAFQSTELLRKLHIKAVRQLGSSGSGNHFVEFGMITLAEAQSLYSASHGAGRAMSRKRARESMTVSGLKKMLANAGVTLIGGSVEENPLAYKDIEQVIVAQQELVTIEGRFRPRIVRMYKE